VYITTAYLYIISVCLKHLCTYTVDLSDEYVKCSGVQFSGVYTTSVYLYRMSVYLNHLFMCTIPAHLMLRLEVNGKKSDVCLEMCACSLAFSILCLVWRLVC